MDCLKEDELRGLLAGVTAPADDLAAHLDACGGCRMAMDRLAGIAGARDATAKRLMEALPPTPALVQAMDNLRRIEEQEPDTITEELALLPVVSGYELLERVGQGGMSEVYLAREVKLDRLVAIKFMNKEFASSGQARQRFLREARAAAAVKHDNVIDIYAINDQDKVPFLVMDFVSGSLQERIDKGILELKEILRIGIQTALGLAAAHKQGLVHRDIKPANILLQNGVERVKITDFGLARAVDDASQSQSGIIAGTPAYMSPQQADAESVDHRSDLYSLGAVMYAMATGHPPFRAKSIGEILKLVRTKEPRPIREANPELPEWLERFIAQLMAKAPEKRFNSAGEVAELLTAELAKLQAPKPSLPPSSLKTRWLLLLAGLAGIAALAFVALGVAWALGAFAGATEGSRDGQQEHPSPNTVSEPPFAILAHGERHETVHPTLADAVASARSGDTIEVRGNGPFLTKPISLRRKALAIRAGRGFRPHLLCQPDDPKVNAPLLATGAPLLLEGLELQRVGNPKTEDNTGITVLTSKQAPLHISHCRFIGAKVGAVLDVYGSEDFVLQHSELVGATHTGIYYHNENDRPAILSLENNIMSADAHGLWFYRRLPDKARIQVVARHNTVLTGQSGSPLNFGIGHSLEGVKLAGPKPNMFALKVKGNILQGATTLSFFPADATVPLEDAVALLPALLSIQDEGNLYSPETWFVGAGRAGSKPAHVDRLKTLKEWLKFWGIAEAAAASQLGSASFQGGDVCAKALVPTPQLKPADFRLAVGSPGKGREGKDVGADVDKVGPGNPYEAWKKTKDYADWQKKTQDILAGGKP